MVFALQCSSTVSAGIYSEQRNSIKPNSYLFRVCLLIKPYAMGFEMPS